MSSVSKDVDCGNIEAEGRVCPRRTRFLEGSMGFRTRVEAEESEIRGSRCDRWTNWKWEES